MARPRTAPKLAVDGGEPPAPPSDDRRDQAAEPGGPAVAVVDQPPAEDLGWERDAVASLVAIPFLVAHLIAKRNGPDDAWLPDEGELDIMAAPLTRIANRSLRLRPLAKFGDGVAFVSATATYSYGESRRIVAWRRAYAEQTEMVVPDADVAGLGVRAARPDERIDVAGVRPWRPPVVPGDA